MKTEIIYEKPFNIKRDIGLAAFQWLVVDGGGFTMCRCPDEIIAKYICNSLNNYTDPFSRFVRI